MKLFSLILLKGDNAVPFKIYLSKSSSKIGSTFNIFGLLLLFLKNVSVGFSAKIVLS